jgi:hypothetical protein
MDSKGRYGSRSVTNRKTRIAASVTAAILCLGLAGSAFAAGERQAADDAAADGYRFLKVQDRGQTGSTFRTAPEFPPTGYLEEFDDTAQSRVDGPAQELARDSFPPAEGSRPSRLGQDFPEYAPHSLGGRVPSSRLQGQTEAVGTGPAGSLPTWGDPPFAPPAVGPDRRMPAADPGGARGDFPSLPPVGAIGSTIRACPRNPGVRVGANIQARIPGAPPRARIRAVAPTTSGHSSRRRKAVIRLTLNTSPKAGEGPGPRHHRAAFRRTGITRAATTAGGAERPCPHRPAACARSA